MRHFPVLHTDRCTLGIVTQEDIPMLFEILNDVETQRFLPELCSVLKTEESILKFILTFNNNISQDEGIIWGVRKNSIFIGFIAIIDIPDSPALFYAMHPGFRNHGYMKECLTVIIQFLHKINLCSKIQTEVYKENNCSQHLLTDIGFKPYKMDRQKVYFQLSDSFLIKVSSI